MPDLRNDQNVATGYPKKNRNKVFFLLIFLILIIAIIIASSVLILNETIFNKTFEDKPTAFTLEVDSFIKENTDQEETPEGVNNIFTILNDPSKSDEEKYNALKTLSFYYSDEYSSTHDPKFRDYSINVIGKYAKENFPSLYKSFDFDMACADPICGQELTMEIKSILNLIQESGMTEAEKEVITFNLEVAGHMPEDSTDHKESIFAMSYDDLLNSSDPTASRTAELLKKYAKSKYNIEIPIIENELIPIEELKKQQAN